MANATAVSILVKPQDWLIVDLNHQLKEKKQFPGVLNKIETFSKKYAITKKYVSTKFGKMYYRT